MTEFWRSTSVPGLEARRSCQERPCYRPHAHDAFSIGVIEEGTSVLTGQLDGPIGLEVGDVVVIPSGCVHACNPGEGRWLYQMTHLDQGWAASLAPRREAAHLFTGIRVLRQPGLRHRVGALNDAIFGEEGRDPPLERRVAALFREFAAASPVHLVAVATDPELLALLRPVLHRLRFEESNPALAELAESVGLSTYQLIRAMRRATGLPPLAWRQNARVVTARRLLREGRPIAETAHALGFTDQSHFHRVFRAHVAASPGVYRG
ncbi:AraC family transcriptional regulator [Prauserella marina]|uniref:AraC-type DNA-binding protein n=1 Tax=Prauserella marina TaxID=530584 RepID=A0A222VPL0_9PSEU|nr:AraC family transcriptional regulator [Prauserella marina]ASR35840.1 AraC family transcriptional regulator [Prauserella marina]PWV84247.1 AraC-like DNA-binding protein [Prauserella marina]SDC27098.1 AraC-type DNA-binding protein [Prauserella marina]